MFYIVKLHCFFLIFFSFIWTKSYVQPKVNNLGIYTAKLIYSCTKWDLRKLRVRTKNFMAMYKTLYQPYSALQHNNKTISSNIAVCNTWCTGKLNDAGSRYKIRKKNLNTCPCFPPFWWNCCFLDDPGYGTSRRRVFWGWPIPVNRLT